MLISLGQHDYSMSSADSYIKRLLDKKTIFSNPKAYYGRYALYSLTTSGMNDLILLLNNLYPTLTSDGNIERLLQKIYNFSRKASDGSHAIGEAISYALLLLLLPHGSILSLEKEVQYNIATGATKNQSKEKGNIVADLYFKYQAGTERNVFYEVDLSTERMVGTNGIKEKTISYATLSNHLYDTTYCSATQLIFAVFDDGWIPQCTSENGFSPKEIRALAGILHPYYFNISLAELALQQKCPGKDHTIGDMLELLKENRLLLNKNIYKEEGRSYDNLLTLLDATARMIPPYMELPVSRIRSALDRTAVLAIPNKDSAFVDRYHSIYQKRRSSIFRMACDFTPSRPSSSIIGRALSQGMMLACCPGRYPQAILPYLLPELFFKDHLACILRNLGLSHDVNLPISKVYCIPLRGTEGKDSYGTVHKDYSTYMRCAFKYGTMTICIENISDDIGGFLRAKEYLRLPPSFRPNTLLILLVNDDGILADGSHIDNCTLYYQEYLPDASDTAYYIQYEKMDVVQLIQWYIASYHGANNISVPQRFLPYLSDVSQDIIMITYSEFNTAITEVVTPWITIPDNAGTIKLNRGVLPKGNLPTPAAPTQLLVDQRPPCNWNHLFH